MRNALAITLAMVAVSPGAALAEDEPVPLPDTAPVEQPSETQPDPEPVDQPAEAPPDSDGADVSVKYDNQLQLSVNDWFFLTLDGLAQFRYTVNRRTDPPIDPDTMEQDKDYTTGFDVVRARFVLGVGLTEHVKVVMRLGVVAGGNFSFQRAFIDLKYKRLRLRAGLFMVDLIAESIAAPHDLPAAEYSIVENVYSPGSSKGLMLTYADKRLAVNVGYSDGLRTGFSEIRSGVNADYAVTGRIEYAWGEAGLSGFGNSNARRGTTFGVRLGAAAHYQDGGNTQGTAPSEVAVGTLDLVLRGNGWSLFLAGVVGRHSDDSLQTELRDAGLSAVVGGFVHENVELFVQYGLVFAPKIKGGTGITDPDDFHQIGGGLSFYAIPNFDNVKLTGDFYYFIGRVSQSLVPSSAVNSIAPNDAGSQWAARIQLSASF